jgi:hypothetical protein
MRIKHDFLEIIILQPERRFNNGSERDKVVNILNKLNIVNGFNSQIRLDSVLKNVKKDLGYDVKKTLAIISKLKQVGFLNMKKIETYNQENQ